MKKFKFLSILIITTILFSFNTNTDFCIGFKKGFNKGYCHRQPVGCVPAIAPICPVPQPFRNTYQDGFEVGFEKGLQYSK
jgi:hypothetical protein